MKIYFVVLSLAFVAALNGMPKLGLQVWTCRNQSFEEMVEFTSDHRISRIQIYKTHVDPADSGEVNLAKLKFMQEKGVVPYSMYDGANGSAEQDREVFELARLYGMEFIVLEPKNQNKWPSLLKLSKEYGIKIAVHNHGRGTVYGDADVVKGLLGKYEDLGVCLDVGWATAAGYDAAKLFREYGDRVLDIHFKDKRLEGEEIIDTMPGEGAVNFQGLFKAIAETDWSGTMAIETDSKEFAASPGSLVERTAAFFEARLSFSNYEGDLEDLSRLVPKNFPRGVDERDAKAIAKDMERLAKLIDRLRQSHTEDLVADVEVFLKNVEWTLRYEASLAPVHVDLVKKSLKRGLERAQALKSGEIEWIDARGRIVRGFRSEVDGSTQVYGVVVPDDYSSDKRYRLDVVLHGSMRHPGKAPLTFSNWFENRPNTEGDFIEVYPLGRVTNGYRFAGETDVFEAIEAVARNYSIDRDRIVLRGFSMGASGTWHIGLRNPDRFVALGPYTGYVDTRCFSEGENSRLIRIGPLPDYQERMFSVIDAIGYVANAAQLPAIAAIGENDIGFPNHEIMAEAYAQEGMQLVNLVARNTQHVIDPVAHGKQLELIGKYAREGLDRSPSELRFVTWTLRYNKSHWVSLYGLENHYERAEVVAKVVGEGIVEISKLENTTKFSLDLDRLPADLKKVVVLGKEIFLPVKGERTERGEVYFVHKGGEWKYQEAVDSGRGKRPGLQGPIDDAFTRGFLCVRGTGAPWNAEVDEWAQASLRRFAYEWNRYMIGDLPIKDDGEVTEEDIRTKNLILFGDPGSNSLIRKAVSDLPIEWTPKTLRFGGKQYASKQFAPIMIYPNPLPGGSERYVVVNSGHTFHESALSSVAYLLYPRLGDWAILEVSPKSADWKPGAGAFPEQVTQVGFFDESWIPIVSR